jgi:hypothetical protein
MTLKITIRNTERAPTMPRSRCFTAAALTIVMATGCSSVGGPEEMAATTGEAISAAQASPAATRPPSGSAFVYFRSNVTDWGIDSGSELYPTNDPNVYQATVTNSLNYDGPASVTQILGATGVGQWGTSQAYWATSGASTFAAPGTTTLVSSATQVNFTVHFASHGQYVVTFNVATHVLSIATSGQDGGVDAGQDAGGDASIDGSTDAGTDGGADAGTDGSADGGGAGTWTVVAQSAPFGVDTALLLTDGRVMFKEAWGGRWVALSPTAAGSYVNGTWTTLSAFDSSYAPEYFGSAVLPDGRVIVEGGEYNTNDNGTSKGRIYDPIHDQWTAVNPPSGWTSISDAESVVLANGTYMLAQAASSASALLNATTLTWTATGTNRTSSNDEEGWTLLPSGKVLSASVWELDSAGNSLCEIYDPATGLWTVGPTTNAHLVSTNSELGPAVLLPSGKVFQAGATSQTSLYDTAAGTWTRGPDFPNQLASPDAPAALLPNGRVLVATGPGIDSSGNWIAGTSWLEFDGTGYISVPLAPTMSSTQVVYAWRLLPLPNGQVVAMDGDTQVWVYTPTGGPSAAWAPTVTSVPATLARGSSYLAQGRQFNGLSQACAYGDDAQCATNYPLVQIQNKATKNVFFARTHGHSTMGVATGTQTVSTTFDVPSTMDTGPSSLVVIANGIASQPINVTVQ